MTTAPRLDPIDAFREALPGWRVAFTELEEPGVCDPDNKIVWIDIRLDADERRETIAVELRHVAGAVEERRAAALARRPRTGPRPTYLRVVR